MFERYTERARRTLFFARYEASEFGAPAIEAEHLLLGLIREGHGLMARVFANWDLSLEEMRHRIEARLERGEKYSTSVEIPFSAEARQVLEFAREEADRLAQNVIEPTHVLVGIFRTEQSLPAVLMREAGMTVERIRDLLADAAQPDAPGWPPTLEVDLSALASLAEAVAQLQLENDELRRRIEALEQHSRDTADS